jgi:hypothetical protein
MLSILYPKEDYTAADVAIRVQALAAGEGHKLHVVPRHFGRQEEQAQKNLHKTTAGLLIACDKARLDETSKKDIGFLIEKKKRIIAVVPANFEPLPESIETYRYTQGSAKSFADTVQHFVEQLKQAPTGKKNQETNLLVVGGLLIAGIILLSNLTKK